MFSSPIVLQVPVDIVVTPTQVIYTNTKLPKPTGCVRACLGCYYQNSNTYTPPTFTHTQQHLLGAPVPTKACEHPRAAAAQGEDRTGDGTGACSMSIALFFSRRRMSIPLHPPTQPITKTQKLPSGPDEVLPPVARHGNDRQQQEQGWRAPSSSAAGSSARRVRVERKTRICRSMLLIIPTIPAH